MCVKANGKNPDRNGLPLTTILWNWGHHGITSTNYIRLFVSETSDGQDPPERIEWQSETIYPPSSSRAATTGAIYFWGQAHIHTVGVQALLHAVLVLTVTGVRIKWATILLIDTNWMKREAAWGLKRNRKPVAKNVQQSKKTKQSSILPSILCHNSKQHLFLLTREQFQCFE